MWYASKKANTLGTTYSVIARNLKGFIMSTSPKTQHKQEQNLLLGALGETGEVGGMMESGGKQCWLGVG